MRFLEERQQLEELYTNCKLSPTMATCLTATVGGEDGNPLRLKLARLRILGTRLRRYDDADKVIRAFKASVVPGASPSFTLHLWAPTHVAPGVVKAQKEEIIAAQLRKAHGAYVGEDLLERKEWWTWRTLRDLWFY